MKYFNISFVCLLLIFPIIILFFLSPKQSEKLTIEDGLIENISAICFFFSGLIYLLLFGRSSSKENKFIFKTSKNYFFLILGLVFLFCFGEEISWGQRMFNISSSSYFTENNIQDEINLHNMNYFYNIKNNQVVISTGIRQLVTPEGIFILFWVIYSFLIPTINLFFSKANIYFKRIYFPVIPFWIGSLFIINQLNYEILKEINLLPVHPLAEIKETNTSFLFLVSSISLYINTYIRPSS